MRAEIRRTILSMAAVVMLAAVIAGPPILPAAAGDGGPVGDSHQSMGFWGDQKGCYWERGVRRCSRYCYWEFDGRRYCQDRERHAHPQGDPNFRPYPPEPPIYLRPPHHRP